MTNIEDQTLFLREITPVHTEQGDDWDQ